MFHPAYAAETTCNYRKLEVKNKAKRDETKFLLVHNPKGRGYVVYNRKLHYHFFSAATSRFRELSNRMIQ